MFIFSYFICWWKFCINISLRPYFQFFLLIVGAMVILYLIFLRDHLYIFIMNISHSHQQCIWFQFFHIFGNICTFPDFQVGVTWHFIKVNTHFLKRWTSAWWFGEAVHENTRVLMFLPLLANEQWDREEIPIKKSSGNKELIVYYPILCLTKASVSCF